MSLFATPLAAAQDVLTIGTVTASGSTVEVPIYVRDVSGTSLGRDKSSGSRIQSLSIQVTYPTSKISSITIARSGITAGLTPTFETKPTSSGSVALLVTFDESSNLIPFTLNAAAPGNQVAKLTVVLAGSATPNSSVALSLDGSLTQLANAGGTTKETVANGQLSLVDGSIQVPPLSISLSPGSRSVTVGDVTTFTASLNIAVGSSVQVNLSSSNPSVATVPSSVSIPAGQQQKGIAVTTLSAGQSTITASLPSYGNAQDQSLITVSEPAPPPCPTPAVPQPHAPAMAASSESYSVTWDADADATDYIIDSSTSPDFSGATSATLTVPTASYTHVVTTDTRYYYRVRAHRHVDACEATSANSATVSVLVTAPPIQIRILPVVGSLQGKFESHFKTSVQLYNPGDTSVSGRIVYHPAGVPASVSDPFLTYSLSPKKTLAYEDLLPAMGGLEGIGSAEIVADMGSALPLSSVRVFNDQGASGTTGLNEVQMNPDDAIQPGHVGILIAPLDFVRFRLNIGIRTLDDGAAMTIVVRDADGNALKTLNQSDGANFFNQIPSTDLLGGLELTGGETISFQLTSGSAFIYGAVTDNVTNDPSIQLAREAE